MKSQLLAARILFASAALLSGQLPPEPEAPPAAMRTFRYQELGFEIGYPSTWSVQQHATGAIFRSPDPVLPINVRVFASKERSLDSFFSNYILLYVLKGGLSFIPVFEQRIEPMSYGSWRGYTVYGRGIYLGVEAIVVATAILAKDEIYLLQLLAPASRSEEAFRRREQMARSLRFQAVSAPGEKPLLPVPGVTCATCTPDLGQTMNVLKNQTLQMMR